MQVFLNLRSLKIQLKDFDFALPEQLIAQEPTYSKGSSRLLHVEAQGHVKDRLFSDLLDLLQEGDVIVFNNTKVIPALLRSYKPQDPSTPIDINLLKEISESSWQAVVAEDTWECPSNIQEKSYT
ncbi:MAG: hypothetical protein FJZ63_06690 [Chlamydiae bacterium]|nr:hypothetical protein [Chlamydiota bacterium]